MEQYSTECGYVGLEPGYELPTLSFKPKSGYLCIDVMGMTLMLPIDGSISQMHDSTKGFFEDLLAIPGVEEVMKKHGVKFQRK